MLSAGGARGARRRGRSRASRQVGWRIVEDPVTGARVGLPGQARDQRDAGHHRHALGLGAGPIPDRDLPHRHRRDAGGACSSSRRSCRAAVSRAASLQPELVRHHRHAGAEEVSTCAPMPATTRCAASPSSTTRRWKAPWTRWSAPMSSAFVPFATASALAGIGRRARRKVEYGTGLVVSATGHVLTDRKLIDGCHVITLPGSAMPNALPTTRQRARAACASMVRDDLDADRLARRGAGQRKCHARRHRRSAGAGWRRGNLDGQRKLSVAADSSPLETAPAPGFAGAAALDAQGRFAGMVVVKAARGRGTRAARREPPWCRPSGSGISSRRITSRLCQARPAPKPPRPR